jgi:hypothetical protein
MVALHLLMAVHTVQCHQIAYLHIQLGCWCRNLSQLGCWVQIALQASRHPIAWHCTYSWLVHIVQCHQIATCTYSLVAGAGNLSAPVAVHIALQAHGT